MHINQRPYYVLPGECANMTERARLVFRVCARVLGYVAGFVFCVAFWIAFWFSAFAGVLVP